MTPLLYTSEMDLPPEDFRTFAQWFAGKHAPDLWEAGFLTCSCYRAVTPGDVTLIDFYQIPSWDVLNQPPYTELKGDAGKAYVSGVNRWGASAVYDQARIDEYVPEKCSFRLLGWLTMIRYDGDLPAIEAALQAGDSVFRAAGAVRARYSRHGMPHPRRPVRSRPEGALILESENEQQAMSLLKALEAAMPASAQNVSSFVGQCVVPWPVTQVHGD
ncbi:hypothetical protein [Devosia sp. A449]